MFNNNNPFGNFNFNKVCGNLINNNKNPVPNKTPGSSKEYDKSNNKIMKFPSKKFDGGETKNLAKNPQRLILKEEIDDTPINYILIMIPSDKKETYLTLNKRLRQLVNEIPNEVRDYKNNKQVFYRDKWSKSKLLKFMPVSFDRLIKSIHPYTGDI